MKAKDNKFPEDTDWEGLVGFARVAIMLKHLCLGNCGVPYDKIFDLIETISQNDRLQNVSIDVSYNNIGPGGAIIVAKALKSARNLAGITMQFNHLGIGLIEILNAVAKNPYIQTLDIAGK
jgi:Ran GTPase-activating protein (RanGAP) involved in mRNA processing and transport